MTRRAAAVLACCALLAARPAAAQAPGAPPGPPSASDSLVSPAFGWLGRGFLGGLATPLGAWWVYRRAGRSDVTIPRTVVDSAAYTRRVRDERREYSLIGGLLGSAVLGAVVIRAAHLGGSASALGESGGGAGFLRLSF